jgi:hypothetical protein
MAAAGKRLQANGDRYVCANTPKVAKQGLAEVSVIKMSSPTAKA